jgi:hypothetical protein
MSNPSQNNRRPDDRFDEAMRALHASAVAHVSPQLRWKLRPAPRVTGGVAGRFGNWRAGPLAAGAVAAALAVAIGLGLRGPQEPATIAPVAVVDAAAAGVLDQDPDFYAWLASEDAELVATLE